MAYMSCLCYNWKSSLYLASIRNSIRLKRKSAFRKSSLIINQDTGEISGGGDVGGQIKYQVN